MELATDSKTKLKRNLEVSCGTPTQNEVFNCLMIIRLTHVLGGDQHKKTQSTTHTDYESVQNVL